MPFPKPVPALSPNTYEYESSSLVKPTGFREYDARWLLEKEINLMGVEALGMGLGTLIREMGVKPEIVTGHDFRSYSAAVKNWGAYAVPAGIAKALDARSSCGEEKSHAAANGSNAIALIALRRSIPGPLALSVIRATSAS